jgi:hypothetical protein
MLISQPGWLIVGKNKGSKRIQKDEKRDKNQKGLEFTESTTPAAKLLYKNKPALFCGHPSFKSRGEL